MPKLKSEHDQPLERLLTDREICESFGIDSSTLNRWRNRGYYPKAVAFSRYTKRTLKSEHDAFVARLIAEKMKDDRVQRAVESHPKNRAGAK